MASGLAHYLEVAGRRLSDQWRANPTVTRQTREKGRLHDGRKRDYEPLAAIKFHVRIRGASCVGFFSCHVDLSFLLGSEVDHLAESTDNLAKRSRV